MSLFGGLFNKDIKQTSETTNVDNTRTTTLTDSLNTWINQNANVTKATSNVYNSAFDATDSFNKVNSYNISVGGGGTPPYLDFAGLGNFFTDPSALVQSLNANTISKDPNYNKDNFNFDSQSGAGNDFLGRVADVVSQTWQGMASATLAGGAAASQVSGTNRGSAIASTAPNYFLWVAVIGGIILGAVLIFKRK